MECVSDMIEEKRDTDFIFGADPAQALWDDLRLNHPWKVKGSQCVRSRFLAFTREAKKELKQYSARQIGYQHLCLEMGWLGETQAKLLKVGGGGRRGSRRPQPHRPNGRRRRRRRSGCLAPAPRC